MLYGLPRENLIILLLQHCSISETLFQFANCCPHCLPSTTDIYYIHSRILSRVQVCMSFTVFVVKKWFKSIYVKYLDALEIEGRSIWGKLLLRKDMDPEYWAYPPCQLLYKGSHTFKPLSGQPLLHLTVHLLLSVFPMHTLTLYSHLFIRTTLKESDRFWSNRDTQTDLHLRYSANLLHSGKAFIASKFNYWPMNKFSKPPNSSGIRHWPNTVMDLASLCSVI